MTQPKFMGGLGFRDFELFNLASLARQSWRLLQNPDSLCGRLLKVGYFRDRYILTAELGSHPSQISRAVLEGRDVLAEGLIKRIGDVSTARICTHNWIPRSVTMRPVACLVVDPPTLVKDLIDSTSASWKQELINQVFVAVDANPIQSIPLCPRNKSDF